MPVLKSRPQEHPQRLLHMSGVVPPDRLISQHGRHLRVAHAGPTRTLLSKCTQPASDSDCPFLVAVKCQGHQRFKSMQKSMWHESAHKCSEEATVIKDPG